MEFNQIIELFEIRCPGCVTVVEGQQALTVQAEKWPEVAKILSEDPDLTFDSLMCLTGYDKGTGDALGVAYNFHSMSKLHKLEIRIEVPRESAEIPSVANIWRAADWHEREVYDLFGITFTGHPDLKRILLPDDWEGYPLRKDYETPDYYHGMPIPKDKTGWE
ncbi:MAG: NADH-quinone oxidoreductase subunit C [FCB group bacterium]|nr:NADH-quinone oxidoreductase subunit C [FCB group bacterium]